MKVKDLLLILREMPPDADVGYVWDGCMRSEAAHVWLAISDDDVVYNTEDRPENAPAESENAYWRPGGEKK